MEVGSKSFATASKLFDAKTRRSVLMLYAWCRHCDDVIDDQVRHDFHVLSERTYVVPSAESRIDSRVIDRIEPRIGAIDRIKKRKQMHAAE